MPQDRLYFLYQFYANTTNESVTYLNTGRTAQSNLSIDRYLFGFVHAHGRLYFQSFLEFDFDASGGKLVQNASLQANAPNGAPLPIPPAVLQAVGIPATTQTGRRYQQVLGRLDLGTGYWIYRNQSAKLLTGFAPTIEAHYTQTLSNAKLVQFSHNALSPVSIGNQDNQLSIVNLILGGTAQFANRSTLAAGFGIPLTSGINKPFAFEFTTQLNYRF